MHISEKLSQFNKKSLFVVAGRRMTIFYFVFNGEIDKIDSIEMEESKYSDSGGFFMRVKKGKFFGSGSVLEDKKIETDRKFLKEVKEKTEIISRKDNVEDIYLFASGYIEKGLSETLSNNVKSEILYSFRGNFLKSHPFDLIKKIDKKLEGKGIKFISEAAIKILRKRK